jgi:hypothetical protein
MTMIEEENNDHNDRETMTSSTSLFKAMVTSEALTGESHVTVDDEGLFFDDLFVPYCRVLSIFYEDVTVDITTQDDMFRVDLLGDMAGPFFKALCESFNAKIQKILLARGRMLLEMRGPDYAYEDRVGYACVRVFEDAVMLLPPNMDARRIPFVFVSNVKEDADQVIVSLANGERYTFSDLGDDQSTFVRLIHEGIQRMQKLFAVSIRKLLPKLSYEQSVVAARIFPEGICFPIVSKAPFPELVAKLEGIFRKSDVGVYYDQMFSLLDENKRAMGFRLPASKREDASFVLWSLFPSLDGRYAVLEFAYPNERAATYVFDTDGDFDRFLMTFNRAFESAGFNRELLYLSEEELLLPSHTNNRMLLRRTPSLQRIRALYRGRVVHRSPKSWSERLLTFLEVE